MKNKLLVLLLAVVMIVCLVSCGGGGTPTGPNDGDCQHINVKAIPAKASTCEAKGYDAYWKCNDCGTMWSDAGKTTVITAVKMKDLLPHQFNEELGICDVCHTPKAGPDKMDVVPETSIATWDKTTLKFQLTEHSNSNNLTSGCKQYLAGGDDKQVWTDDIGQLVTKRNGYASSYANADIVYSYCTDTAEFAWGANIQRIYEEVNAKNPNNPDMYANFTYDMVGTSLKGSFINLYTKAFANNFKFAKDGYVPYTTDDDDYDNYDGYMFEYMQSMTLSKNKMYLVASDYLTDLVRSFFVVPVNIAMINTVQVGEGEGLYNSDRDGDGEFTINDFYQLVWAGQWNYDTLAAYSSDVSHEDSDTDGGTTIQDTVGFAIATSTGLSASGLLYTTPIVIINRVPSETNPGEYTYNYPATNADLTKFAENLSSLMKKTGIITLANSQTAGYGEGNALGAIRERFSTNNILFGGIICVGSLEYEEYQTMNKDGEGFGVVPVPLYRVNYVDENGATKVDQYLTQIHNVGKVIGISASSKKFTECSTFIDYQSTHSTQILNTYYDQKLQYTIAGGEKETVKMLQYIRQHVRSAFDKTFEDAISVYFADVDPDAKNWKWHDIIRAANFQCDDMATQYETYYEKKEASLQKLVDQFNAVDDV